MDAKYGTDARLLRGGAPWLLAEVAAGTTELFWGTLDGPVTVAVFSSALQAPGMFDNASGDIASLAFDESRNALWYGTTTGLFYESVSWARENSASSGGASAAAHSRAGRCTPPFLAVGGTLFLGTQAGLFVIPAMATMATWRCREPWEHASASLPPISRGVNVYWSETTPEAPSFITGVFTCPAAACEVTSVRVRPTTTSCRSP